MDPLPPQHALAAFPNVVDEVCGFVLAIAHAWSRHCICIQMHVGDIADACTCVPPRLPTFIPIKMQPKKMKVLVYSTYNRMTKFRTKLRSHAREYEDIVTAHEECGCSFYKFHEKLLLKIPTFALRGSVRIQSSVLQYSSILFFKPQMENFP